MKKKDGTDDSSGLLACCRPLHKLWWGYSEYLTQLSTITPHCGHSSAAESCETFLHLCTIMDVQIMIQRWRNTHIVLWKYFQDRKIDHSKTIIGDTEVWNGTKNFIGSVFRLFLVFSFILTASLALSCRFNSIHRISLLKIIIYIKCKLLWPTAVIILNMLKKTFCFISSPS